MPKFGYRIWLGSIAELHKLTFGPSLKCITLLSLRTVFFVTEYLNLAISWFAHTVFTVASLYILQCVCLFQLVYQSLMNLSLKPQGCCRLIVVMFPSLKLTCMFYYLNTIVEQLLLSDVMAADPASQAAIICPLHSYCWHK